MRFSVKRLTRSDLTLFEDQLRVQNAGQQKAINLNRSVFVDILYPGAARLAGGRPVRFPVDLRIYGPEGESEVHRITRKIIAAGGTQKNWRLNGETIHSPTGTRRYTTLGEGDYAILGFDGDPVPDVMLMILLTQDIQIDAEVIEEIRRIPGMQGVRAMSALNEQQIAALVAAAPEGHLVRELLGAETEQDLQDAAFGNAEATRRLRRRSARRQTAEDLAAARERAQRVGRDGEVLVEAYLRRRVEARRITTFTWEANVNAISPFDFTVIRADGSERRVEVKSTTGTHDRPMHISQAEIEAAADREAPRTEIWRVSELDENGCVLRRSIGLRAIAETIRSASCQAGEGMVPDGWTVRPSVLRWSDPITLRVEDDPEE